MSKDPESEYNVTIIIYVYYVTNSIPLISTEGE
jgi:hypothetical protein